MKYVYDLTPADLEANPVWYYPMDGAAGNDETSVSPLLEKDPSITAYAIIARARFLAAGGVSYPGYVHWAEDNAVDILRPLMWIGERPVNFWNGMIQPSASFAEFVREGLGSRAWPIHLHSEAVGGMPSVEGTLEGIYYINELGLIVHIVP